MIINEAAKSEILAKIEKFSKKVVKTTKGPFAFAEGFGLCETTFIVGSQIMVKRALSGQWTGFYGNGVLQHEEFA